MRKLVVVLLGIVAFLLLSGCGGKTGTDAAQAEKIPVSVSFDAMREFVEAVGGDKVQVSVIIPDGTEPHEFEPKADDLKGLHEARLFVINGLGMEPWAEAAAEAANNEKLGKLQETVGIVVYKICATTGYPQKLRMLLEC